LLLVFNSVIARSQRGGHSRDLTVRRDDSWSVVPYFFTSGQRDSSSDWNASSPGIVASSL
jgi:hypothetical protein